MSLRLVGSRLDIPLWFPKREYWIGILPFTWERGRNAVYTGANERPPARWLHIGAVLDSGDCCSEMLNDYLNHLFSFLCPEDVSGASKTKLLRRFVRYGTEQLSEDFFEGDGAEDQS